MNYNEILLVIATAVAYTANFSDAFMWSRRRLLEEYSAAEINRLFSIPVIDFEFNGVKYSLEYEFDINGYAHNARRTLYFYVDNVRKTLRELRKLYTEMSDSTGIHVEIPEINFNTISELIFKCARKRIDVSREDGRIKLRKIPQIKDWGDLEPNEIKSLEFPQYIKLPDDFWTGCTSLKEIIIGTEFQQIPVGYFMGCPAKTYVIRGYGPEKNQELPDIDISSFPENVSIIYPKWTDEWVSNRGITSIPFHFGTAKTFLPYKWEYPNAGVDYTAKRLRFEAFRYGGEIGCRIAHASEDTNSRDYTKDRMIWESARYFPERYKEYKVLRLPKNGGPARPRFMVIGKNFSEADDFTKAYAKYHKFAKVWFWESPDGTTKVITEYQYDSWGYPAIFEQMMIEKYSFRGVGYQVKPYDIYELKLKKGVFGIEYKGISMKIINFQ